MPEAPGLSRGRPGAAAPRVVAAPNAFKGALPAARAAEAIVLGAGDAGAGEVLAVPVADGGDGTAEVLRAALGGSARPAAAEDPWGRVRHSAFVLLPDGSAVVDAAAASGLGRQRPDPVRALAASTLGTGHLVRAAVQAGARTVRVALGGSATSDGGAGLLTALGAEVRDAAGHPLAPGGGALAGAASVDLSGLRWLEGVRLEALVDVRSPLLGPEGAAAVFSPQKGAGPEEVQLLERGLSRWADLLEGASGRSVRGLAGAGAAGGAGFALATALGAPLRPGAAFVVELLGLRRHLGPGDLVLTGEGALDGQTARGKAPAAVAAAAAAAGATCCALTGSLGPGWEALCGKGGLAAAFPLSPGPRTRARALAATFDDLRRTAAMVIRLFTAGRNGTAEPA